MVMKRRVLVMGLFAALLLPAAWAWSAPPEPGPRDKCPVCGMFVSRHPDWLAVLEFSDRAPLFFCSPKDAFKFQHFPERYLPQVNRRTITAWHLKDYYSLSFIDGTKAFYVTGSRVLGPMGKDLIPLADAAAAAEFMHDHAGEALWQFGDITPQLLQSLD